MKHYAGVVLTCITSLCLTNQLAAQSGHHHNPGSKATHTQGPIQQTAYYADHGSADPCPDCERHAVSYHPQVAYHHPAQKPTFKQKIVRTSSRSARTLGQKWRKWSDYWYAQDQMFRQRNLTQSIALFGNKDLHEGPQICDQCRHGVPHYVKRYDMPQYPRDPAAIIPPEVSLAQTSTPANTKQAAEIAVKPANRQAPREIGADNLYQVRRNNTEKKSPSDTQTTVTKLVQNTPSNSVTQHDQKLVNNMVSYESKPPAKKEPELRSINISEDDGFVLPVIKSRK
ncbi:MAG: hypothetical protein R3C11_07225 [Planctomycetaceae bacterium]